MGDQIVKLFKDFMFLLIPGLVYFIDVAIVIDKSLVDFNFFAVMKANQDFSLFFAGAIILFSYIFGFLSYQTIHAIWWVCHLKTESKKFKNRYLPKENSENAINEKLPELPGGYYNSLVMTRNLLVSFVLLIALYFCSFYFSPLFNTIVPILTCIILIACLIAAWWLLRHQVKLLNEVEESRKPEK